jgi:hypothetical protein
MFFARPIVRRAVREGRALPPEGGEKIKQTGAGESS